MLLASVMFLVAAVLRMRLGTHAFLSIWLTPVFMAMIYAYASRRVIHPVYVIGLVALCHWFQRPAEWDRCADEYRQELVEAGELTEFAGFPSVPIPA